MKKYHLMLAVALLPALFTACKKDKPEPPVVNKEYEETYAGGKLGTTFNVSASAYEDPTPAVEQAGLVNEFKYGEYFFERPFTQSNTPFNGLGPLYIRSSCEACHPGYGHGKRMDRYRAGDWGNGYLLVVTDDKDNYLSSLTGMPQTKAVAPFKAPIDETKIRMTWKSYTDEWGNRFEDGETYSLIYPEVYIPEDAYYVPLEVGGNPVAYSNVRVRLEGTIGIYSSMYQFVLDMLDEAIKKEFPNLKPAYGDSFFFYGGTSSLITKLYGEMETGVLDCDMLLVAEPAFSLELKEAGYHEPVEIEGADKLLRFPYDADGCWYPVRVCNMVLAYNPEMTDAWAKKGITIPHTFKAFAEDPALKGYISMGNPMTSGTTFAAVASLTQDNHYGKDYLKGLAANEVMIESGSTAITKLQTGECAAIMILEESILKALKDAAQEPRLHLPRGRRGAHSLHRHDRGGGPLGQCEHRRLRGAGGVVPLRGCPEAHHGGLHALCLLRHEGAPLGLCRHAGAY